MVTPDRKRAVLLVRPGPASERLRDALQQAGADVVLVADPSSIAVDDVISAEPDSVLIALDAVVEQSLDRFDAVLGDPSIAVIFDEAELAAKRDGWDAARWVRHLQAKLYGHDDVLPPGQTDNDDDWVPQPGLPTTPQQHHAEASFRDYAGEADEHTPTLPVDAVGAVLPAHFEDAIGFENDDTVGSGGADAAGLDFSGYDIADEPQADSPPREATVPGLDDFLRDSGDEDDVPTSGAGTAPPTIGANDWGLDDDAAPAVRKSKSVPAAPAADIEELERRISGLSLADADSYGHGPLRGAVVLTAGLGGPDAVRQLLKGLPEAFPRPVLVLQRLDGGQYAKLVGQMARASAMPVQLAEKGVELEAGNVYIVPPTLGLARKGANLMFDGSANVLAMLPPSDSAVVLLSGSDEAIVDPVLRLAAAGTWVAGQASEGCFEPAAASNLVARGGEAGLPAQLAERLSERWPA